MAFIPLRVHTAFSLSEGAIHIKSLAKKCKELELNSIAVTDTNNLFGAFQFSKMISGEGVQPIIGCEISVKIPPTDPRLQSTRPNLNLVSDKLVLLAKGELGYKNLMKISSQAFRNGYEGEGRAEVSLDFIKEHSSDLICLTAGTEGSVGRLLAGSSHEAAEKALVDLKQTFGDRLYVEITRQGHEAEEVIEASLIDLAYKHDIPLVATNPAYFLEPDLYEAHEALLCIAGGNYISQDDRRKSSANFYLKSQQEMEELFKDLPEALENTVQIAKRCAFMVRGSKPLLPPFETPLGEKDELSKQAHEGLKMRLETQVFEEGMSEDKKADLTKEYTERLDFELSIINQMGFDGYFLIVADFIKWAFDNGVPVGPGRGSGAGSVVAWSLKITGLDPIRYGLLFERFLNPERVSMPDFDIDFCQERRDEVINYVSQKYGSDHVAQIITFGKLQAKAVVRDVGRVLQMPYGQVDRLSKLIPNNPANPPTLQEAIDGEPLLQEERRREESVDRLLTIGLKLEGLYRHASTHAAGVVIGGKPLEEIVGIYYDPKSAMPATQFNMKDVESVGLVKFDFLGLKTLSVLKRAVKFAAQKGVEVNLDTIPMDDRKSYELLHRMETVGIFQLESSGMRDVVGKLKPDHIEDITALVALYRPGPMENIPKFVASKHGLEDVTYPHPLLEETLRETYGVAVYQEQVMKIAQVFAGYTLGGADLLRRAMGKKIKEEMDAQRKIFVDGAAKCNNVPEKDALSVFEQVEKFAGYGFNKSHAAAYAFITYQTAYMKANFPAEFMAASMAFDMNNVDKLAVFKQDIERMGKKVLPPDINLSDASFKVEETEDGLTVRYALGALKNVGEAAMEMVVAEREKNGPFKDIIDFARRLDSKVVNKRQLENLICSGSFDSLHKNRKQLLENMDLILSHSGEAIAERESKQVSLFGGGDNAPSLPQVKLSEVGSWPKLEELQREFDAVGFYLTAHPMEGYGDLLAKTHKVKANTLIEYLERGGGESFKIAGIIISKQERTSKASGKKFAFVQLSDETGVYEVGVFSETYLQYREQIQPGLAVSLGVSGKMDEGSPRVTLQSMETLDAVLAKVPNTIHIKADNIKAIQDLAKTLEEYKKGKSEIKLTLETTDAVVDLQLPQKYTIGEHQKSELFSIKGLEAG